ncbi:MAG: PQQ-binding-like beta-propeller repeat protein [Verrucomicrobiales bacterium]
MNLRTLICTSLLTVPVLAADWPNWRGPHFNGSTEAKGLPASFSPTENVKWKAMLPGPAGSSPIVVGDTIFLTAAVEKTNNVVALALDAKTGAIKWNEQIADRFRSDDRSNFAGPSPASDGKRVVFFAGSGDLASFTLDGKKEWHRNIQKDHGRFAFLWTFSTSPVLHDGRLYMQVLQRNSAFEAHGEQKGEPDGKNESYLLAIDPATGKDLWRVVRPADAVDESLEAFTTPIPATLGGRKEILISGGDCISGHDPATGKELWRWGTWNPTKIGHWRLVPSPVADGKTVLACAPKGAPVYAVKAGLQGAHTAESALTWRSKLSDEEMPSRAYRDVSSDVATPLFYQGHYYILNGDKQRLACVKPDTGEVLWHEDLGGRTKIEASPTAGDGKIYVMDHRGEVFVVKADPAKFERLHRVEMMDRNTRDLRSTIAIAHNNLFIRTEDALYCVGK